MSTRFLANLTSRLRTATQGLTHRLEGKRLMGKDAAGNCYFVDDKNPSKRFVEYAGKDLLGDSSTVPMSWYSWLRHTRSSPPTAQELEDEVRQTATLAAKVAAIKEADAKLRMQEIAEKAMNDTGSSSSSNASMERDQRGGVASWNSNSGAGKK